MKFSVLLIAATALTACSSSPATENSAKSPMTVKESLDIASATKVDETTIAAAKTATPSADAVCKRGSLDKTRSFIICEDGALRKAGVMAALSAPHDPDLKIADVASSYEIAPQVFTGIENATYGRLINGERQLPKPRGKHKAKTGLVQIQGKVYEVYQLSTDSKSGTIFVEQKVTQ